MQMAAIQASRRRELSTAVGTDCAGLKSVERLSAVGALPIRSHRRRRVAAGTLKAVTPRKLGHLQKILRMFQAAPAVHQHVEGNDPQPGVARINGKPDASDYSQESKDGGDQQAASSSQDKPKHRTQYLPAVEWIDGKNIEN